jgi:hypothetical protein
VPVIIAGLRQATVMVVAIATVGATVGANDLGQPIISAVGRSSGTLERLLSGVIPVAVIGIVADLLLAGVQRVLSRGRVVVAATGSSSTTSPSTTTTAPPRCATSRCRSRTARSWCWSDPRGAARRRR